MLSENYRFDSLPVIVATTDVAIIGKVTAKLEGVTVGDEFDSIDYFRFEVDVEEVLNGKLDFKTIVLQIDEVSLANLDDTAWTQTGERSVMFLVNRPDDGPLYYSAINSQSIYRIVGADRLEKTIDGNFTQRVAAWSLPELRTQINTARAQIGRGEVQPKVGPVPRRQP